MRQTNQALKTYRRQHSDFYPIWLWILKIIWSEEMYFSRVVMGKILGGIDEKTLQFIL